MGEDIAWVLMGGKCHQSKDRHLFPLPFGRKRADGLAAPGLAKVLQLMLNYFEKGWQNSPLFLTVHDQLQNLQTLCLKELKNPLKVTRK